jgi:hypothetical protein
MIERMSGNSTLPNKQSYLDKSRTGWKRSSVANNAECVASFRHLVVVGDFDGNGKQDYAARITLGKGGFFTFFEQKGDYLRGLAFLKLNETKKATKEFDKILDHRGEAPLSDVYPLARLGKARAAKNQAEYEKFFGLWKDADKDMPALIEAKKNMKI